MIRCQAITHGGVPCARAAMRGERVCASHAGRCGARPGNRNAIRHGLYSRSLSPEEKLSLAMAYRAEGVDEEIGVTRLMIARALRDPDVPPAAYAQLVHALCRQLRLQGQLSSDGRDTVAAAIGRLADTVATDLGLGAGRRVRVVQQSRVGSPTGPNRRRALRGTIRRWRRSKGLPSAQRP